MTDIDKKLAPVSESLSDVHEIDCQDRKKKLPFGDITLLRLVDLGQEYCHRNWGLPIYGNSTSYTRWDTLLP